MWDATSIKIKCKLPKIYGVLVYDAQKLLENCHVTGVLPSRDSETKKSDSEN